METLFIAVIVVCISAIDCETIESDPMSRDSCEVTLDVGLTYLIRRIHQELPDVTGLGLQFDCVEVPKA